MPKLSLFFSRSVCFKWNKQITIVYQNLQMMWFVKPEVKMTKWGCGGYYLSKFKECDMVVTAELLAQCLRTPGDFEL